MTTHALQDTRLWFALAAAPAAWIAQGLCGWLFGSRACAEMTIGTIRTVMGGVSLAALVVAAAAMFVGLDNWRTARREGRAAEDRVTFMALGGVLVSSAFLLGIFWASLNAVFIDVCGGTR